MQAKADAHKKLLAQYEAAKGLNNRQSHDLIDHCQRLIRIYEQAVATNMIMAESHRQLAAEAKSSLLILPSIDHGINNK